MLSRPILLYVKRIGDRTTLGGKQNVDIDLMLGILELHLVHRHDTSWRDPILQDSVKAVSICVSSNYGCWGKENDFEPSQFFFKGDGTVNLQTNLIPRTDWQLLISRNIE